MCQAQKYIYNETTQLLELEGNTNIAISPAEIYGARLAAGVYEAKSLTNGEVVYVLTLSHQGIVVSADDGLSNLVGEIGCHCLRER